MTSEDKPAGGRRFAPPSGRRRWLRIILMLVGIGSLILASAAGVAALWAFTILPRSLPSVKTLETFQPIQGTKVYDDNDELLTELHVERRIFVPLAHIPQTLRDAVIATEDRRFYSHFGVDPIGVARAVWQNYRRGRIVEGGSTITQQLTKVLFLTPDKSLERKMKEAALALELERRYSKDRILEMYMNQIYFGNGAYGVEAAARTYFGKSVTELSLKDAALLAGLPRAPSTYSPFEHPEAAKRRREVVLRRLVEYGAVKDPDAKKLARADLGLIPPERRRTTGQYFLEFVQQTLEAKYGADMVFKGGLNVYTTLNPTMQLVAEQSLRDGLKALEGRSKTARPGEHPEGAIVTIEPQTGYVRAMVGGYDFFRSEFNRAVQARRQPGSAFKPFVYVAALESGFTPADRVRHRRVVDAAGGREAGQLRPEVPRPDDAAAGRRGVDQRGHGQAAGADRAQPHRARGAPLRDHQSPRREPEPGAGHLRPHAARAHLGVRHARQPGRVAGADDGPLRDRRAGQAAGGAHRGAEGSGAAGDRVRDHPHAARRGRARNRAGREGARPADRRQDGHDQ